MIYAKALLEHRRKEELALIIFNIKQRGHDSYLITPLETANHPYETRGHDHNLILPKPNANALRRTVTYRSIQLWNDLIISNLRTLEFVKTNKPLRNCVDCITKQISMSSNVLLCPFTSNLSSCIILHIYLQ